MVTEAREAKLFAGSEKSDVQLLLEATSVPSTRLGAVHELDRRALADRAPYSSRLVEATKKCTAIAGAEHMQDRNPPLEPADLVNHEDQTALILAASKVFPFQYEPPHTETTPLMRRPFEGSPDPLSVGETAVGAGCFLACANAAGMVGAWMAESDPDTREIAKLNCPTTKLCLDSVFDKDPAALPWVHVLMGGTCCQPFSRIGKRQGWQDDRAYTTLRLLHIATVQKNWFVVMENVAELLIAHEGKVWELIQFTLRSEGYHVQAVRINPVR